MPLEAIEIEPYPIDSTIHHIKIYVENFHLNRRDCWCLVHQYDKDDVMITATRVYVPPEIYMDWGTNDSYLEDWVMDYLGMIRKREFYPFAQEQESYFSHDFTKYV